MAAAKAKVKTGPFEIGDTVVLNSGGPIMSITSMSPDRSIWCTWFAGKKNEKASFKPENLLHAAVKPNDD